MKRFISLAFVVVLAPGMFGQSADEKKATIAYLHSLESKEGGFLDNAKATHPTLRGTTASLRALRYMGGTATDIEACKKFVLSCRDRETGGFANQPGGKPDVATTAVGLMALVELKIPTESYEKDAIAYMAEHAKQFEDIRMAAAGLETVGKRCDKNEAWLDQLARKSNANGTFGKGKALARDTGSVVAAVLRLGGKVKDPETVVKMLDANQRKDGGFGREDADRSDLETSYRVTRSYHMLKALPARADDLRAFIATCRNRDSGYGVRPGAPSSAGGTYFASIVLYWLQGK